MQKVKDRLKLRLAHHLLKGRRWVEHQYRDNSAEKSINDC